MNECCCKGKAIPPVPVSMKKLLHLLAKGPTQSEVSQSALVTLHRHAWVDGSSFPVPLQKPGTANTHTHTHTHTHTIIHRNTRVMLCRRLMALKFCQELLKMLKGVQVVFFKNELRFH